MKIEKWTLQTKIPQGRKIIIKKKDISRQSFFVKYQPTKTKHFFCKIEVLSMALISKIAAFTLFVTPQNSNDHHHGSQKDCQVNIYSLLKKTNFSQDIIN